MSEAGSLRLAKALLLATTGLGFAAMPAAAQQAVQPPTAPPSVAAPAPAADAPADNSTIVVTGSRLVTNGVNAPTPVTVVSAQQLALAAPRNLVDGILQLPQFRGNISIGNQANGTTLSNGSDYLNLRGLGTSRTLVLMDGRRLTPNQNTSAVDAAQIPEALVQRVDIVTGGASAAYGSDAVAGVVNFVLNNKFEGVKANAQGGLSSYGDNGNYKIDLTVGKAFMDGRLHVVASVLDYWSAGVPKYADRPWTDRGVGAINNPNVTATNPASPTNPKQLVVRNPASSIAANGGLITDTILRGTTFDPGGAPRAFQYGQSLTSTTMAGFDPGTFNSNLLLVNQAKQRRDQFYLHATYDVSDDFSFYVQGVGSRNAISFHSVPTFEISSTAFTIFRDNAYLPASLRATMQANNIPSFTLGRLSDDIAVPLLKGVTKTGIATAGFDGKIGGSSWQYHAYGQIGRSKASYETRNNPISNNLYRATDAVVNPANGQTVCRSSLTDPSNGCVPINLFGYGSPSQASLNYILGTAYQQYFYHQEVAEATASGKLFTLPAGDVSLAFGGAWRHESLKQTADAISQQIRTGVGINGFPRGLVNTLGGFERTNPQPAAGEYNVKEAFVEVQIPLLADLPFAKRLEINAAARYVSYSTSGSVWPWKVGVVYAPTDWLRFRGTRSTDIRAPNLGELYKGSSQGGANVIDPFRNNVNIAVLNASVGNPDLRPEIAHGTTVGFVLTPRQLLPGFNMSVDYYQVRINRAIATLSAQQVVSNCFAGSTNECGFILRGPDGNITRVLLPFFNAAFVKTRGVDAEASYTTGLSRLSGKLDGTLSFRLIVNYLDQLVTGVTGTVPVDAAGDMYQAYPKWQGSFQTNLKIGNTGLFVQERYIGGGKYTSVDVAGGPVTASSIDKNHVGPVWYTDITLNHDITPKLNLFLSVTNLFDRDPPMIPGFLNGGSSFGNAPVGGVKGLYDFIGRMISFGVHAKF
jgi:iron complex outermembrane receptor protein